MFFLGGGGEGPIPAIQVIFELGILHFIADLPGLRLVLCIQLPVLLIGQLRGILVVQGLLHGKLDQQSDAVRPSSPRAPRR